MQWRSQSSIIDIKVCVGFGAARPRILFRIVVDAKQRNPVFFKPFHRVRKGCRSIRTAITAHRKKNQPVSIFNEAA